MPIYLKGRFWDALNRIYKLLNIFYFRKWVDSENQKQYTLVGVVTGNPSRSCTDRDLPDVYNFIGNEKVKIMIKSKSK